MRFFPNILVCFVILIGLCVRTTESALAEQRGNDQIGTVLSVEGIVDIASPEGNSSKAQLNSAIYLHDTISTETSSKAFILFIDNTELTLAENTTLKIDEYIFNPDDSNDDKAYFSLLKGAFSYLSGLLSKKEYPDVNFKTKYGSIGIRGTEFWSGELDNEFGVYVHNGKIAVSNDGGSIDVAAGTGTSIKSRKMSPSEAKAWGKERLAMIRNSVRLKQEQLVRQRIEKIKTEQAEIKRRRQQEIKKELQDLLQDKHKEMKLEIEKVLLAKQETIQKELQREAKGIIQSKLAEIKSIHEEMQNLKQQLTKAQSKADKRAIAQKMKRLGQKAKSRVPELRQEAQQSIKQAINRKFASLKQDMDTQFEQLQNRYQGEFEREISRVQQDQSEGIQKEMRGMLESNQRELKEQLGRLHSDAERQVEDLLNELNDRQR